MIQIPVSVGELIDKLSILHIKKEKIKDSEKLKLVEKEFDLLFELSSNYLKNVDIETLYHNLCDTNNTLWEIEDRLRIIEREKRFQGEFISYARKVYFTNDKRFELKNKINEISNSEIKEVKQYVNYK